MRSFIQLFACSIVDAQKVRAIGFMCDARWYLVSNTGTRLPNTGAGESFTEISRKFHKRACDSTLHQQGESSTFSALIYKETSA